MRSKRVNESQTFDRRGSLRLFLLAATVPACRAFGADSPDLVAPFDPPPPAPPGKRRSRACANRPEPIRTLDPGSKYRPDGSSSIEDPDAEAAYRAATRPVRDFVNLLVRESDLHRRDPRAGGGACAHALLESWARAGALEDCRSHQGHMVAAWTLAAAVTTWLKIADGRPIPASIRGWFERLAEQARRHMTTETSKRSRNNNHLYWVGWARMATAITLQDGAMFSDARRVFDRAVADIDENGVLPLELERKGKALHYHQYALGPIVMMAEALTRNGGPDAYRQGKNAIGRLADLVLRGLADETIFARLAGTAQDMPAALKASQMAWMEPYGRRYPTPAIDRWVAMYRPMVADYLGGDLTLLYRRSAARDKRAG